MAFFGAVLKPGKATPQVPHPEEYNLHLSQACLSASVPKGKRVSLLVNHEEEDPVVIATLVAGQQDTVCLDLFFSEYVEWTLQVCLHALHAEICPCAIYACDLQMHLAI